MMRFERLWSTERGIWDWTLHFFYLFFLESACVYRRLAPRTDLKACVRTFGCKRSWLSEVVSDYCAPVPTTHTHTHTGVISISDWGHGFRCVCFPVIGNISSDPAETCQTLWGGQKRGDCLSVFVKPATGCSATQYTRIARKPPRGVTSDIRTTSHGRSGSTSETKARKF